MTYCKAGVTPGWTSVRVIDTETGDDLKNVIEVDTVAGYVVRYQLDCNGHPVTYLNTFATERVHGRFEIVSM